MDLSRFDLEELLLAAIKSEVESNRLYTKMAKKTKNGLLGDKLEFLAIEEEKHRLFIEDIYKNHYPENKIILPKETPVPLPEVKFTEDSPLSRLLKEAMKAEQAASNFYKSLASRFEDGTKLNNTLLYFSDMEIGHLKILQMEKDSMERFEEGDVYWPMVHVGP
ncbi:MAG: ferritin family protein [Thermoplasmatales archaeon]|nr:MAG: ferritin family protein [Thermoplasmatales archaeon]